MGTRDLDGLGDGLGRLAPVKFEIRGDAGTVMLVGQREGHKAAGSFGFIPNNVFKSSLPAEMPSQPDGRGLLVSVLGSVTLGDIIGYARAGLKIDLVGAARLKSDGVSLGFAAAACRKGAIEIDDLLFLKDQSVNETFLDSIQKAGFRLSPREIVSWQTNGVTAEFVDNWKAVGIRLRADEFVRLQNGRIPASFGNCVHAAFPEVDLEDLVTMKVGGVTCDYMEKLVAINPKLKPDEIVRLRTTGVSVEYFSIWRASYPAIPAKDIVSLRRNGVDADYAAAASPPGRKPLTIDTIIHLRSLGVTPQEVRQLRE